MFILFAFFLQKTRCSEIYVVLFCLFLLPATGVWIQPYCDARPQTGQTPSSPSQPGSQTSLRYRSVNKHVKGFFVLMQKVFKRSYTPALLAYTDCLTGRVLAQQPGNMKINVPFGRKITEIIWVKFWVQTIGKHWKLANNNIPLVDCSISVAWRWLYR